MADPQGETFRLEDYEEYREGGVSIEAADLEEYEAAGVTVDPEVWDIVQSPGADPYEQIAGGIPTQTEFAEAGVPPTAPQPTAPQPGAPDQPLPFGAPLAEPPAQQMLGAPADIQPVDPAVEAARQQHGLPPTGEPAWITRMNQDANQQWVDWVDVPPGERQKMLEASADIKIAMRRKASANTLQRIKKDLGYLIYINRGYGPKGTKDQLVDSKEVWKKAIKDGASREEAEELRQEAIAHNRIVREGRVYEEPFRYGSLDNFLAETWLRNPWLRGEEPKEAAGRIGIFKAPLKTRDIAFGLSRAAFSARAHEKVATEHKSTLEHLAFYLAFPARYTQALVAKGLGHKSVDAVLAAHMYGEHGKTGDAIATMVPEIVESVKQSIWPAKKVQAGTWERIGGITKEVGAVYEREVLSADDEVALEKKAKMLVALAAEITIDPMWFVGFGATSSTKAALGQVAKAARMGKVKEVMALAKGQKQGAKILRKLEKMVSKGELTEDQAKVLWQSHLIRNPGIDRKSHTVLMKGVEQPHTVKMTLHHLDPEGIPDMRNNWVEIIDDLREIGMPDEAENVRLAWNDLMKSRKSQIDAIRTEKPFLVEATRTDKPFMIEAVESYPARSEAMERAAKVSVEEAKDLNKKIMDEAKDILSETGSINEARKRIKIMLGKHAGPEAVRHIDEIVGEAWGKHGLTFRIPFMSEGIPLPAWSPLSAEKLASYRASMRLMSGLVRRGVIQSADALLDTKLLRKLSGGRIGSDAAERFQNGVILRLQEGLAQSVIPNYRYSTSRKMDWAADDAASRLLDDVFGGSPIETTGLTSRKQKGLQTEIDEKQEELMRISAALDAPAPPSNVTSAYGAGKRRKWFEAQRDNIEAEIAERQAEIERLEPAHLLEKVVDLEVEGQRMRLSRHLGNILLIENKPMRSSAIRRFRKRLLREKDGQAVIEFDPVLRTLEEGKWPEYMAKRGHPDAPIAALREARFESKQAEQLLNAYASLLDAAARSVVTAGKPMAKAFDREIQKLTTVKGVLTVSDKTQSEREFAGRMLSTAGKDFMDILDEDVLKIFPPEDLARVQRLVTFAADEFAMMAEEAIRHGIDLSVVDNYYPGIYQNMVNVIPHESAMEKWVWKGAQRSDKGPSGMNPMMRKNLSSAQATAMGLKPEHDIVKMVMARRLAHEQAMSNAKMIHEVLGTMPPKAHRMPMPANALSVKGPDGKTVRFTLGREIDDPSEVARGAEAILHWRKPELDKKGNWNGNWIEQDYAVSKEIKEGMELAMQGLTDTHSAIGKQVASVNTWFRGILTSPNPGYHMRNAMSNTVLAWMAGVRDPTHYAHAFFGTLAESSPAALKRVDDMIASLTKAGKTGEAANLSRFRQFRQWANKQVAFELPNGKTITYGEFRTLAEEHGVMNKGFSSVDLSAGLDAEIKWASSPEGIRAMAFMGLGGAAKGAVPGAAVGAAVGAAGLGAAAGAVGGALGPNSLLMRFGRNTGEFIENQARMAVFSQQLKSGVSPRVAAAHVDKYLYNYRNITAVEGEMRQVFLFYTWMRKNMPRMVEELATRPGRISAGTDKLVKVGERFSEKDWKDARTEYRQRYYAKMGGIPLPGKSKGGLSMLALDLPWRDLNLFDLNSDDFMSQMQSMLTPIAQIGINGIAEALEKNLYGFGKGKTWVGNEMVEAPVWLRDHMPGEAMVSGRKSGAGWKKKLGFELRPDPALSAKTGVKVLKEYMPEHVAWWFNQIPMMAFATKFSGEDLTKEERRAYDAMSYLFGWRQLLFDETASQEQNMFEVGEGVRREAPGRLSTAGRKRDAPSDAKIAEQRALLLEEYRKRKAAGKLKPTYSGQWLSPHVDVDWPGESQHGGLQESREQMRARALRAAARGR